MLSQAVLSCAQLCQSMSKCVNCAQLCQMVKINLFLVAKNVPICATSVQNVRNLPSYAQFGTVLHSLTYFGIDLHSSSHFSTLQHKNFFR